MSDPENKDDDETSKNIKTILFAGHSAPLENKHSKSSN